MSANGAKLLVNKGPPRKATIEDMSDAVSAPTIITPHALPMFRDSEVGRSTKRKREKERMDPRKSRRPELPVTGPGRGGRVGASATQHVVQNLVRDTTRDEDVRATPVAVLFKFGLLRVIGGMMLVRSALTSVVPSSIYWIVALQGGPVACASVRDGLVLQLVERSGQGDDKYRDYRYPDGSNQSGFGGCRCDTPDTRCHPEQARGSKSGPVSCLPIFLSSTMFPVHRLH